MTKLVILCLVAAWTQSGVAAQHGPIEHAIVREADPGPAPQITTAELRDLLAGGTAVVLDARPAEEFGISHIPGALNVAQKPGTPMSLYVPDVSAVLRLVPDRGRPLVVYCNGPFCGKSRRFAEELVAAGYRRVRRYQLGIPVWRALGGVAAIDAAAIRRVAELDGTAVFVDAGLPPAMRPSARSMVRLRPEEVTHAKDDGRLPMHDHNTRIVVIGRTSAEARVVAEAIAANAFHNVAYYDGSGEELQKLATPTQSRMPDVLREREAALAAGDTAGVLRLFADDAVVVTSSGRVLIGNEPIAAWVQDQITRRQREHARARHTAGAKASWAGTVDRDDWRKLGVSPLDVRQDAVVEAGKIRFFNTTLTPESSDKLRAATARGGQP